MADIGKPGLITTPTDKVKPKGADTKIVKGADPTPGTKPAGRRIIPGKKSGTQQDFSALKVFNVSLFNTDGSKHRNISALVTEVVFVEDIFSTAMHGYISIKDGVDLLNGGPDYKDANSFAIAGEEFVEIRFQPAYNRIENKDAPPVVYKFAVYSITNMEYSQNNMLKNYTMRICSAEHLIDATTVVMKAYSKQHSQNIKDLCRDYLNLDDGSGQTSTSVTTGSNPTSTTPGTNQTPTKANKPGSAPSPITDPLAMSTPTGAPGTAPKPTTTDKTAPQNTADGVQGTQEQPDISAPMIPFGDRKKLVLVQETKGPQQVIIPRLTPFQAATFMARRSLAADDSYSSGSFLFFENQDGYNFCDIECLIKRGIDKFFAAEGASDDYIYYFENPLLNLNSDKYDAQREFKTVIKMNHVKYFDTIDKIKFGMFESDTIVYDYINHKFTHKRFRYTNNNDGNNSKTLALGKEFDSNSYPTNSDTFLKKVISKDDTGQGKYSRKFLIPKTIDNSLPDTYLDDIYAPRASFFASLSQNMYQIQTYGDTVIKAGDVIVLNVPKGNAKEKDLKLGDIDPRNSGYFLVGTIKHVITPTSYATAMDIYKNAANEPMLTTNESQINQAEGKGPKSTDLSNVGRGTEPTTVEIPSADPTDLEGINAPRPAWKDFQYKSELP